MGLIADIQSDIEKGAVRLIAEYRSRLVAEAHRLCENQSDVEDLVSRTLVKVINNIDSHDESCDFYAWMKSIMVNQHRDDLDRPVTRGTQPVDEETLEQCAGVDWSTDEQIVRNSDCEALRAALRDIPPEYRQTVILRFYEDLSLKEIASILNKPVGTVGRRIHVALHLLAGKLSAEFGKAKKPLAVLLAALLGVGALFGAWQTGLLAPFLSQSGEAESFPLQEEALPSGEDVGSGEAESFPLQEEMVPPQLQPQSETSSPPEESQSATTKEQPMNMKTVKTLAATAVVAANAAVLPQTAAAAADPSALGAMANVIYVAPDGAGSGTSWEDATDLATAFTTATAAGGGEIWIKEGTYRPAAALTPCSNLTVRGGFAGTESTAAEADSAAHPTILSAMATTRLYGWSINNRAVTKSDPNYAPIWTVDGAFNIARADDVVAVYRVPYIDHTGYGLSNLILSSDVVTDVRLEGLTFTCSRSVAVSFPAGSDCYVSRCRFLACGVGGGAIGAGALSSAGTLVVSDSDFIGCGSPLSLSGTETTATNKIVNCRFEDNTGASAWQASGAITTGGQKPLEITGCTFRRNTGVSIANNNVGSAVISLTKSGQEVTIADCLFEENRVRCAPGGNSTPNAAIYSTARLTIMRCLFKGNTLRGSGIDYNHDNCVCLSHNTSLLTVRDTVFAENSCVASTGRSSELSWASVAHVGACAAQFVNCSFYGNKTSLEEADGAVGMHVATTVRMARRGNAIDAGQGTTFVNCLFSENSLAGAAKTAELRVDEKVVNSSHYSVSLINTVVWNKNENYRSYITSSEIPVNMSHVDLVDEMSAPYTNGNHYAEYITAVDPFVSGKPCRKTGTYPYKGMLCLSQESAFARAAIPIYEVDGLFYFYEPIIASKPWRRCVSKADAFATLEGAGNPIPDAFGRERVEGKIAYGPALNIPSGLMLMLK